VFLRLILTGGDVFLRVILRGGDVFLRANFEGQGCGFESRFNVFLRVVLSSWWCVF
jgi:hypothetical protein